MQKCFACGKALELIRLRVDTRDDQIVFVGPDCFRKVQSAGESGYQPPLGGPRLWMLEELATADVPRYRASRRQRSGSHDFRRRSRSRMGRSDEVDDCARSFGPHHRHDAKCGGR